MFFRSISSRALVLAALLGFAGTATAQEPPKPTDEHKILAQDEGTWDAVIKSYDMGPDAQPTESKGVEVNTVLTGGLWVVSKFEGKFSGATFEGRGQFGYDASKKKYIGTWIDSMSPSLTLLEGSYDEKTKTMTYTGEGVEPSSKSKYTQKMVTTLNADGTRTFALYMKGQFTGNNEVKMMEIKYTKRK